MDFVHHLYQRFLYSLKSKNAHGVHSPFVFELINSIFDNPHGFYAQSEIEAQREAFLTNPTEITFQDFGASGNGTTKKVSISTLAAKSLIPPKYGKLLFHLVNRFQPATILELGTCLGISGLYLKSGLPEAQFYSLEGGASLAKIAQKTFENSNLTKSEIVIGNIDEQLKPTLEKIKKLDFAYLDANHRYKPTVSYFETILPFTHNDTVLVFDDIHWSEEMTKAWKTILKHPKVTVSIDLFKFGIIFFRKEQAKEHFTITY